MRRKIHIFFLPEDELQIRWYETPGKGMIMEGLESITEEISNNFLYGTFKGAGGLELLHRIMEQTIEPVSHGYLVTEEEDPGDSEKGTLEKENAEVPGAQSAVASVADDAEPAGSTAKDLQE